MQDAASWFLDLPNQSLGFILADSGYDVWVANTRGTRYSRGHETLDASAAVLLLHFRMTFILLVCLKLTKKFDSYILTDILGLVMG